MQQISHLVLCVLHNLLKYATNDDYNTSKGASVMERVIFHIDINHCYAQIEEMKYPKLRVVPMAVGGHEETRHGIILAKNDLAKNFKIKTGETLRDAYKKCKDLVVIPPHYEEYMYYTEQVKNIYRRYSDQVESFGLDEAWIDVTRSVHLFGGDGVQLAKRIQQEVLQEIGLTVSVGVSYNKIFAKLGSDMKKPSGMTVITKENYKEKVWPLPVEDLLYVGRATEMKLKDIKIFTIGDLANTPPELLQRLLGAAGPMLYGFANGLEGGDVSISGSYLQPKSIGNSMTLIHDVKCHNELRPVLYIIAESIASRLKDHGLEGEVVSINYRDTDLNWCTRQRKLLQSTDVSEEILKTAMQLFGENWHLEADLRAVGISVSKLKPHGSFRQIDLFSDDTIHFQARKVDETMDQIREKYGFESIKRACTLVDAELCDFNPKGDHTIHPVGFLRGRKMSS